MVLIKDSEIIMSLMKKMNTALSGNKKKSNKKVDGFLKFRFGLKYRLNLYERKLLNVLKII